MLVNVPPKTEIMFWIYIQVAWLLFHTPMSMRGLFRAGIVLASQNSEGTPVWLCFGYARTIWQHFKTKHNASTLLFFFSSWS